MPYFWCNPSGGKVESDTFLLEGGILTAVFSGKCSGKCLYQQSTDNSPSKFYLQGFMFDERNVKLFSNAICEMQLQELTLDGCGINDELASLLVLPSGLKSVRLERLNLSPNGIQRIIDKLISSLESLELINCLFGESITNSTVKKESLDFSRFSHLKSICIENLEKNFDSYQLLLSLSLLPLERIKLSCVYLSTKEWTMLLNKWGFNLGIWAFLFNKWKGTNRVSFLNSLKEFNLEVESIDESILTRLVHSLFSFPCLEIISFDIELWSEINSLSLPPLPSNIKHFSIPIKKVFINEARNFFIFFNSRISFYNTKNLSHLTHMTVRSSFESFPYDLFGLNQLEYLDILFYSNADFSLKRDQRCEKLKYLSIGSKYLIYLLKNFENNFPLIETLLVSYTNSVHFNPYLKTIISSQTLKRLEIDFFYSEQSPLKIEEEVKSSIEELKLTNVWWKFVSHLLTVERFPCLKKIHIKTKNIGLDLKMILEKLTAFPQLTSLVIIGKFSFSNETLPFTFENLKFFCLEFTKETFYLDCLLSCMPNLNELQLEGQSLKELKVRSPIYIRYLSLPFNVFVSEEDFINIVKNIPYLIQLSTNQVSLFQNVLSSSELAYYFSELKVYFQNELQFNINPNCLPINQLKNDDKLNNLVRLKSSELTNYLNRIFPLDSFKLFIKQLFTIEIVECFNCNLIDNEMIKRFFSLISELEIDSKENVLFLKKILLGRQDEYFTEVTDFSPDNFYDSFLNYFIEDIGIKFQLAHLEFIREFFKANKKYGPIKIYNFLESFFSSLLIDEGESDEIFNLFSMYLLAPSFHLLFDKIKENMLSEEEKKFLLFDYSSLEVNLRNLEPMQYEKLCTSFKGILIELCDESFVESLFDILKAVSITEPKCYICFDFLLAKECKFFKSLEGNCHLYHIDCLNEWLEEHKTCPECRKAKV